MIEYHVTIHYSRERVYLADEVDAELAKRDARIDKLMDMLRQCTLRMPTNCIEYDDAKKMLDDKGE